MMLIYIVCRPDGLYEVTADPAGRPVYAEYPLYSEATARQVARGLNRTVESRRMAEESRLRRRDEE